MCATGLAIISIYPDGSRGVSSVRRLPLSAGGLNRLQPGQVLAFKPGADIAGRHGLGKQVALGPGAAEAFQRVQFCGGLHAFDDACQLHVLAQGNQRLDDLEAGRVEVDVGDEGAIHLQFGQRQRVYLAEAGIAGAEVVEGNAAAQLAKPADRSLGLRQVLDGGGFGDFQIETGRVEAAALDQLHELLGGVLRATVVGGQVE